MLNCPFSAESSARVLPCKTEALEANAERLTRIADTIEMSQNFFGQERVAILRNSWAPGWAEQGESTHGNSANGNGDSRTGQQLS